MRIALAISPSQQLAFVVVEVLASHLLLALERARFLVEADG